MKNIMKTAKRKLINVTENVIVGTTLTGMTIGTCAICTTMDVAKSAMAIGLIAVSTPITIINTNTEIIKTIMIDSFKELKEA